MLALLTAGISAVTSLFGAGTSIMASVAPAIVGHIPIAFWLGIAVGLFVDDGRVRDAAIHLGTAIIGAVL